MLCHVKKRAVWISYGLSLLVLTALYVITGHFGLSLETFGGFATLVWLPSGIAVTALFLGGYRLWPSVMFGAFLVNLLNGASPLVAVGIGIGDTLEAIVCTALLKRQRVQPALDTLHDAFMLGLVAIPVGAIISATIGVGSLLFGRMLVWPLAPATWITWWLGDLISMLQIVPLLLTWSTWKPAKPSSKRLIELSLLGVLVLAIGTFVFLGLLHPKPGEPTAYLVFPPLIWAALRFGLRGATATLVVLSCLAVVGTILGVSFFRLGQRLFFLQCFLAIMALTTLLLSSLIAERDALEKRKDLFLTMVSHELRTPLTSLHGYAQLLKRRSDNPRDLRALVAMEIQTTRLTRLIEDLLDLSKIQSGNLTFTEETVDMDMLVRDVAEDLQQTSTQHQINIEGNPLGTIIGDHGRLGQVLNNLLTNAIKYSPESERIIIHFTSTAEYLTISVQDFGIGIPIAEQEKIFERFYRVNSPHRNTTAGLGIGLSIAYQIIEHYKGRLWVESVEGQGSTFSFSLHK